MKRTVESSSEGLTVEVSDISGQQEQLFAEFQACQEGRCSCPTKEYEKLDSLNIEAASGIVRLTLKAKSGQVLDESEIQKCLDHTEKKRLYPDLATSHAAIGPLYIRSATA